MNLFTVAEQYWAGPAQLGAKVTHDCMHMLANLVCVAAAITEVQDVTHYVMLQSTMLTLTQCV
jgi:hypothetical protein